MWKYNDELYHYGVIGMRWGVRTANKYSQIAKAARAKGDLKKEKMFNALAKSEMRTARQLGGGRKVVNAVAKQSVGKTMAQILLMGDYGSMKYHQARAAGATKGKAVVKGLLYDSLNMATVGMLGSIEPSAAAVASVAKGINNAYKFSRQKKKR